MATVTISDALASRLHALAAQENTSVEVILEQYLETRIPKAETHSQRETVFHANLYRAVVETMVEGVIVRNPDGTVIDCNASALQILDMSRERLMIVGGIESDWTILNVDGTSWQAANTPAIHSQITGQPHRNVVMCAIKPDATELWLSINTHPLFLTGGDTPDYVVSIFSDVTAFRHATKLAEKSAAYWQYISDLAFEGIAITEKGVVQDANNRLLEITGYMRDELVGKPSADLVHAGDIDYVRRKAVENSDIPYQHRLLRKDGTVIPVEIQTKLLSNGLRVTAVRDISRQHEIEQELEKTRALLQAAVEQSPTGIIIADVPDVEIQWVNQAALKIRGYDRLTKKQLEKHYDLNSWQTYYPNGTPYPLDEMPLMRAAFGEEVYAEEMLNSNQRWVLVNAAPIRNTEGDIIASIAVFSDITERKEAENALRRSEERYRNLLESAPIAIGVIRFDVQQEARYVYANAALVTLFRAQSAAEIVGRSIMEFSPQADREGLQKRANAYRSGEKRVAPTELRIERFDGTLAYISVSSLAIEFENAPAVMSVMTDITERKQVEDALRRSEERYRNLLEAAPSAMIVNRIEDDNRLRVAYVNPAALRLFKTDNPADIVGHDNDKHVAEAYHNLSHQRTQALLQGQPVDMAEYKLRRIDGTEIVTLVGSIFIDYEGHPAFLSVYNDITERKATELALRQSEDRYRRMLENAPVGIFVVRMDDQATVRYVNPTGAAILAAEPDMIIGHSSFDLMPPASTELMRNRIDNLTTGNTNPTSEYALKRSDGQLVYVRASSIPITYDNEPSALTVLIDVTERHQAEAALRRRDAILGAVAYAAEQFLRNRTLESSLQTVLERLGQATEVDRAYVFEHYSGVNGKSCVTQIAEWVAEGIKPEMDNPKLQNVERYTEGWIEWDAAIDAGQVVSRHVKDFIPGVQAFLREQNILSIVAAPILIGQSLWGYIGLDSCREERDWSQVERDALKAAAETLAAAIERKRDEEALRFSEERLRLALNSTGTGIWQWDIATNHVQWSDGVEPIFGLEEGTFAGTYDAYLNLIHPDDYDMVLTTINSSLNHADGQYYIEHRTLTPQNRLNWIEAKGIVLRDDNGQPIRMLGIIENITARKAAQIALQEREARINRQNDALIQLATVKALGTGDLETALREITATTGETLNVARVSIWFYIENETAIRCELLYNTATEDYESGLILRETQYPGYFHALRQNRVIAADDASTDVATYEFAADYLPAHGITSLLDAPIRIGGKTIGVVCNEHVGLSRQWTYDDQHFVTGIADLVALAIESRDRRQAEAALRQSEATALEFQDKLRQIHEIAVELSQRKTVQDVYRGAIELGRSQLGFERLGLWLIDDTTGIAYGTYGTDENGQLRDETQYSHPIADDRAMFEALQSQQRTIFNSQIDIKDHQLQSVGSGWNAATFLWDGQRDIGWFSTDAFLTKRAPRPYELDLLTVYGTSLAHFITQRRTQDALRRSEETALAFQERLRTVHDITLELSQQESLADVYRLAVELGRSKLGFDRLGLWMLNREHNAIMGTYGTDETGQLRDEQHLTFPREAILSEVWDKFNRKERIITDKTWLIEPQGFEVDLDEWDNIPQLWTRAVLLWNGKEGIGWLSADNYLHRATPRPYEFDLLIVYATALGNLITQRRAEQTALAFQQRLRTVHDITLELSRQESLVDVYRLAVELGRSKLGFDRLGLWVLNDERDTIIGTFGTDNSGQLSDEQHLSFPLNQLLPEVLEVFNRKERILTRESGGIFKAEAIYEFDPTGWNVVATLWNGSEGIGWLSADNYLHKVEPRPYEFDLLTVYATALGSLITQRWTEDHLKQLVGRLQLLGEIDRAILRSDSPETIAQAIVQPLKTLVQCDYVGIVLTGIQPDAITLIAHSLDASLLTHLGIGGLAQRVGPLLDRGEVVQVEISPEDTGGPLLAHLREHGMQRLVFLPMLHDAVLVGTIILGMQDAREVDEERLKPAQEVAAQLSVALRQNKLYQQVQDYAESLEHKVAERTKQLQEKASELEAFTYSVSHDLRAPLRAINGFSDLLMEAYKNKLDEKAHHYLDRIYANSKRMGQLIDDLLKLSRIGRTELKTRELDTHKLVQTLMNELQSDKQTGNAMIHLDNLPPCHADEALLKQVFINLLSNAIKYSQKVDKPTIHIGSQVDEEQVVFFVRDNGVGFDMKYADKLFGVFQRLHDARDYEGTGIGLATVQRIISLHSGKVWAEATVNGGATFYFTLPENESDD